MRRATRTSLAVLAFLVVTSLGACVMGEDEGLPAEHEEPADLEEVPAGDGKADTVSAVFNRHDVVTDALFTDHQALTVDEVQLFLEDSPYENTSWLATYTIGDKTAAEMIVEAAARHRINPIMLLSRMQVEASLVSKTTRPTTARINAALGCGCHDGQACNSAYRGLARQLECGADTMRKWYDGSEAGDGLWEKGRAKRTLDPLSVTPANHATASLYAYTPWVLVGRGGNWLVWNVTRKYVRHAEDKGWM